MTRIREKFRRWGVTNWSLLLQVFLALALLVALVLQTSPMQILVKLANAAPLWLLLGFGFFVLADVLRTLRFTVLLGVPIQFHRLLPVVIAQGLANTILPARLGEVSYLYLLRSRDKVPVTDSLSSLILARLADVWALLFLFLLAIALVPSVSSPTLVVAAIVIGTLAGGTSGIVLVLARRREVMAHHLGRLLGPWLSRYGWLRCIQSRLDSVMRGLEVACSPRAIGLAFVFSLSIWLSACLVSYCLIQAVGVTLPLGLVFCAAVIIQFLAFLPIHVLGGLGTLDISWAAFFVLFGLPQEQAIVSALTTHLLFYAYIGLESLGGVLALWWMRPRVDGLTGTAAKIQDSQHTAPDQTGTT